MQMTGLPVTPVVVVCRRDGLKRNLNWPRRGRGGICEDDCDANTYVTPNKKAAQLTQSTNGLIISDKRTDRRLHLLIHEGWNGGAVLRRVIHRGARVPREQHQHVDRDAQQDRHPVPEQPAHGTLNACVNALQLRSASRRNAKHNATQTSRIFVRGPDSKIAICDNALLCDEMHL